MSFAKDVRWVEMTPKQARKVAIFLINKSDGVE